MNREDKRTTVSLAVVVWEAAQSAMDRKGFNKNFSAYVADLIRRDQEAADIAQAALNETLSHRVEPPAQAVSYSKSKRKAA